MSLSLPSAVWILTVRKTLQHWAKVSSRSACGKSSMTECHSSSQRCDVQSASTSRPWPALESMHNWGKVRIKQARRMIAATSQNTEREEAFLSTHSNTMSLLLNSHGDVKVSIVSYSCSVKTMFVLSPLFHHISSQMARRQTSQWMPMKTSISSRVHSNFTSGICPIPSSHTTLTPGSSKLQVSHETN